MLSIGTLYAQYQVKGKIVDSAGEPISYVNAILLQKDSLKLVKGGITDDSGVFVLRNIAGGEYQLKISLLGFKEIEKALNITQNIDLGSIVLAASTEELDEVVIKAEKPVLEQKVDRLIANVEGTLIGNSGNALEVLERLPGIEISPDGSSITLNGRSEVGILINGKLTRIPLSSFLQILSSTNAKDIKNIELITTPPAKYDAEFTGGLININQIRKNDDGANASILVGLGYGDGDKEKAGINWNVRKDKINFYGNANFDRNNSPRSFSNTSTTTQQSIETFNQTTSNRKPIITGLTGQLGLDYYLNEKTTLGVLFNGSSSRFKQTVTGRGFVSETPGDASNLQLVNTEDSTRELIVVNLNLGVQLDSLSKLSFDIDYLNYYNENPTDYDNTFLDASGNILSNEFFTAFKETPVNVWVGKTDYSKRLNSNLNIELGGKYTFSSLDNTVLVQDLINGSLVQNDELSELSNLTENIVALYSSANWKINDKTDVNLGLRYEYSTQDLELQSSGNVLDRKINALFPSLFLSRKFGTKNTLQFSYGRRITRPTYFDLAPFLLFLDPNTFFNGNVELQASISNSFSLSYKYKKYLASFEFTHADNAIARSQSVLLEDTGQQVFTSLNLDYLNTYALNLTIPVRMTSWWNSQNTFQLGYLEQELNNVTSSDLFYSIRSTQDFKLSDDIRLQLFARFNSERLSGVTNINSFNRVNLSLEKKIETWNSRLQISYNNIFGNDYSFTIDEDFNNSFVEYNFEPRVLQLTWTYDFGNSKVKKQRQRTTGSKEIKNRIN
jgi:hypothetical protein